MRKSITKHVASMNSDKKQYDYFFPSLWLDFDNIVKNLSLPGSGECSMAFARKKHSALALASRRTLFSIPVNALKDFIQLNFNGSNTFGTMKMCLRRAIRAYEC